MTIDDPTDSSQDSHQCNSGGAIGFQGGEHHHYYHGAPDPQAAVQPSLEVTRTRTDNTPKLIRGLPDGEVVRNLRASRDAELSGRYGESLSAAQVALRAAETLRDDAPASATLLAAARSQMSHCILAIDGDPEEAWRLADLAASPAALATHRPQFFIAIMNKAEAAIATGRLSVANGALTAAADLADGPGDARMILQARAMAAMAAQDFATAIRMYAEAAESFLTSLNTEPDEALRTRWKTGAASTLLNCGLSQQRSGDVAAATQSFQRAAGWYHESNSIYDESVARRFLARALFDQRLWVAGHKEVDTAVQLAHDVEFWSGEAEALELRGRALATQENPQGAREALKAAHALLSSKGGAPRDQRRLLQMLATIEAELGDPASADTLLEQALRIAEQENDALAIADVDVQRRTSTGTKRSEISAPDEVVAHIAEQLRTEERPGRTAMLSHKLAGAYRSRGELEPAEKWYVHAHETATSVGDLGLAAAALIGLAELALHNDNVSLAEQQLDRAATTAKGIHDPELVASLNMFRARILAHRNDYRTAQQLLGEALNIAVSAHLHELVDGIKSDLEKVDTFLSLFKPAMSLKQLASELSRLEAWYPEQQAALRRFWYYWRDTEILANLRAQSVSKALFVAESASSLRAVTEELGGLFDLDIFVPESAFADSEPINELVPFPADQQLPFCVNVVTVREMHDDIDQHLDRA